MPKTKSIKVRVRRSQWLAACNLYHSVVRDREMSRLYTAYADAYMRAPKDVRDRNATKYAAECDLSDDPVTIAISVPLWASETIDLERTLYMTIAIVRTTAEEANNG